MSTNNPLNATQSLHDSPLEAPDSHKETDSLSSQPKDSPPTTIQAQSKTGLQDSFPPLPSQRINESGCGDTSKKKGKKRKGKKKRKPRLAGKQAGKPSGPSIETGTETQSQEQTIQPQPIEPQAGEEGVRRVGRHGIGLHPEAYKNVDQKGTTEETQPIEGVEDVLGEGPIEEVETRAAAYAKVKAVWEKAGDVCVRVYARPLNPRLVLVEWEGEDGVEKHGKIVVGERQRGMFGPGKVVWVRGPLVGDRWVLAGKYNFLGNRVS